MEYDFFSPLLEYVKGKAKSFLENYGLGDAFDDIEWSAKNKTSVSEYINKLLNDTVSKVAEHENEEWDRIREEFNSHYLSK